MNKKTAQSASEYALMVAAVLAAVLAMQIYYSRAMKGGLKEKADSIAGQFNVQGGAYNHETRSMAGQRQSQVVGNGTYQSTEIDETAPDVSFVTSQVPTLLLGGYAGGEVSEAEYVDRFGRRELSRSGVADHGSVSSNRTVWQDAGLEK